MQNNRQQKERDGVEPSAVASCKLLLDRLVSIVQEENDFLTASKGGDHRQFTERKTQLLRDLLFAERCCRSAEARQALTAPLHTVKRLLSRNQTLLAVHIKAVKDVSSIIVDVMRRSDSDGTYTRSGRA